MTQVSEQPPRTGPLVPPPAPGGPEVSAATAPGGSPVEVEPGTLMEKLVPRHLVEPYLTSQRSVIAGFVRRAPGAGAGDAGGAGDSGDQWVLRWRALQVQTYLIPPAGLTAHLDGADAGWLFMRPAPVPVDAAMYRITAAGEEFVARHDGQAWLRPAPRSEPRD